MSFRIQRVPPDGGVLAGTPPRVLTPVLGWVVAPRWQPLRAVSDAPVTVTLQSRDLSDYRLFDRDQRELTAEVVASVALDAPTDHLRILATHPGLELERALLVELRTALRGFVAGESGEDLIAGNATRGDWMASWLPGWTADAARFGWAPTEARRRARETAAATDRRVLLVGIDSADWVILRRLFEAGELPHLRGLVERGASGPLHSITPLLSPLIWTTIATGVSPERHGILDFVTRTADGKLLPVGSGDRRVPALWTLLEAWDKTVVVSAWLATYPAEPVPGSMVTDRFGFLPFATSTRVDDRDPRAVHPESLLDTALSLRVSPATLDRDLVRRFVQVPEDTLVAAVASGYRPGALVNNLVQTLAATETTRRVALHQWTGESPDLGLIYFEMVDAVGHLFMPFTPPRLPWIDAERFDAFRGAVDAAYRYQDEILGDFLATVDERTLVVVVSDHGFKSGEARPRESSRIGTAAAARWHTPEGILVLAGPGVRPGTVEGARVHDIAPTLLAYLGCAPPASMEGRVLREAFTLDLPRPLAGEGDPLDAQDTALEDASATTLNNLGLRYLQSDDPRAAADAFRRALERDPQLITARNNLAQALLRLDRAEEAETELRTILEADPQYALGWMNLGLCLLRLQRPAEAVDALHRAAQLEPRDPRIQRNLGFAALENKDWPGALDAFTRSLDLEETAAGQFGRGVALLESGDRSGAVAALDRALELDPTHEGARRARGAMGP